MNMGNVSSRIAEKVTAYFLIFINCLLLYCTYLKGLQLMIPERESHQLVAKVEF